MFKPLEMNLIQRAAGTRIPGAVAISTALLLGACASSPDTDVPSSSASSASRADGPALLGRIDFPATASAESKSAFDRGVLFLHNFEYADARTEFQRAAELDPDMAMAYWGEAMTHNHPIWMRQDTDEAKAALERYAPTPEERRAKAPTPREADYLATLDVLFGLTPETAELDKPTRDDRYLDTMTRLVERYPDDHEAKAFLSLATLGTAHEGRDFRTYMQAAAIAQQVWEANDQHPGAAHYLIHSFDDPIHAPLGLPMANVYADIAPDAAHAQHMTSHIFVALGLWDRVATANVAARRVQTTRQRELGEPETVCGHYPYWLQYSYLQLGEPAKAQEVLTACEDRIEGDPESGELWHYSVMRARQVLDGDGTQVANVAPDGGSQKGQAGANNHLFMTGYSAALAGDGAPARRAAQTIAALEPRPEQRDIFRVQRIQLEGLALLADGRTRLGLERLADAADLEDSMPFAFGPPEVIKPSWELLGEQRQTHDGEGALEAFERQLARTPRRVQSLRGLATELERAGRDDAADLVTQEIQAITSTAPTA